MLPHLFSHIGGRLGKITVSIWSKLRNDQQNTPQHGKKRILPDCIDLYSVLAWVATRIQQRWERYKIQVPEVADFIDESLADLAQHVQSFLGTGLVASHNDICNANWLVSPKGQLYLIDLESMTLDDPACDIGATLWWYYPPELRKRFLEIVGYPSDEPFRERMRVRMAMHCLSILLPREMSFDGFDSEAFADSLTDFRAILAGRENPQGYDD
jgi:thiamine kinase-like enzyme